MSPRRPVDGDGSGDDAPFKMKRVEEIAYAQERVANEPAPTPDQLKILVGPVEPDAEPLDVARPSAAPLSVSAATAPPRRDLADVFLLAAALFTAAALVAAFAPAFLDAVAARDVRLAPGLPEEEPASPATGGGRRAGASIDEAPDTTLALTVDSVPPGADVAVNGEAVGQTPQIVNASCTPGQGVSVDVALPGYAPWSRKAPCLPGRRVSLVAKLTRLKRPSTAR